MTGNFVEWLRPLRLEAGLSQEELARRARVSVRAVRDIEQGRVRNPRPESLQRLAEVVGLSEVVPTPAGPPASVALTIGVLGPLTITADGAPVEIESARQRVLLGILALQANQIVPRGEIIDALWGEQPPDSCVNLVHTYVARLRRKITPPETRAERQILRTTGGYLLRLDHHQVDALRFTELLRRADAAADQVAGLRLLRSALALWRGPVLADLDLRLQQHPAVVALAQRRLATVLTCADLSLDLAEPEQALPDLQAAAYSAPFHEGLHARLMLALAATGQQEAALRLHTDLRTRLREQLGVEPGAELRAAQLRVLRQNVSVGPPVPTSRPAPTGAAGPVPVSDPGPAPRPVVPAPTPGPGSVPIPLVAPALDGPRPVPVVPPPAQLPADVLTFSGRADTLIRLDALAPADGAAPTAVVAITGMAGVGKTAVAVYWAHRNRHRFPDGQLYVNLRGYSTGRPLSEIEALAGFLHALGVPPERVPIDPDQAAGMYRTLLAGRRMLVLLDNAAGPDQVRPLLPGTPGCLVLVTSRQRLNGMVAVDGAQRVGLDVFAPDEAHGLLTRLIPDERRAVEPEAVAVLARACAYLPLALRIAAANLNDHPDQPISGYVARFGANRLTALEVDGDAQAAVRAAFDLSYAQLAEPARRLFRLIGVAPVLDVGASAAGALAGDDPVSIERLLGRLASAHLIQQHGPGRYSFHDLIRLYAVERAETEDLAQDRATAVSRLYDWCQRHVDTAADLLYRHMLRLPGRRSGPPAVFADPPAALSWLDAERRNLTAVAAHAADHGPDRTAWSLVDGLRGYLWLRGYSVDLVAAARTARSAAERAGDLPGQVSAELCLASAATRQSRYREAANHTMRMAALARQAAWPEAEGAAFGTAGPIYWRTGQLAQAADAYRQALTVYDRLGGGRGRAPSLGNLGLVCLDQGLVSEAAELSAEALTCYRELGETAGEAIAHSALGRVCHLQGRWPAAIDHLTRALTLHREIGHRLGEETSLERLAAVHRDTGDHVLALSLARAALEHGQQTGDAWHEASARNVLASIHAHQGQHAEAVDQHLRALALASRTGERSPEVTALAGLAAAYLGLADLDRAVEYADGALTIARECGYRLVASDALTVLARVCLERGDLTAATRYAEQALASHREVGYRLGEAETLRLLGQITADDDERTRLWREAADILPRSQPRSDQ